jgi:hypothetical protein
MTYLFNSNTSATISNEVEIKNDVGNAIPITGNVNSTVYNSTGKVTPQNPLPVTLGGANISIYGNTNIIDTVTVSSTPETPVHVHLTEIGTSGNIQSSYMPIQGNVNVTNTVNVTQGTTPWVVSGNVTMLTNANTTPEVSFADTIQMDTTDRLRVSTLGQQWWYVPSIDKDGDLRIQEKIQNTASSTFIQNLASVRMSSGFNYNANSQLTGSIIRASRRRHKTRPGVSQEWQGQLNWDGLQSNVVKRAGLFTNFNGIFFEANATTLNAVVRRRLTDGTLVETRTPHTAWTKDKMDGAGITQYNWANTQNIVANVTSVLSVSNVAVLGNGNVYVVNYQMPAGEETKLTLGKKVTLTGITPIGFNDTGLVTAIDTTNHRANVAYITFPGTYSSATNAKMTNTPFHQMRTYWIDYSGNRTGRVRFGLVTDKGKVCVHEYLGGDLGTQWMSAPALMDRKEIVNTATPVDFLPSLTVAGSAITIETQSEINPGFGVAQSNVAIAFDKNADVGKEFALIGIGIREGEPYQRADIQAQGLQMVDIGNSNQDSAGIIQWRLVLNPTVSAVPTPKDIGKATHMYDYAQGTTITGGIDLLGGYSQGSYSNDVRTALNFLNMGSNIDYTAADIIVFAAKLIRGGTDNSKILGTISYLEDL